MQNFSCKYPHIKLPTKKDLRSSDEDESSSDDEEEKYPFVLTQGKKSYRVQITGIYSNNKLHYDCEGKYDKDDPEKPDGIDVWEHHYHKRFFKPGDNGITRKATWLNLPNNVRTRMSKQNGRARKKACAQKSCAHKKLAHKRKDTKKKVVRRQRKKAKIFQDA